MLSFQIMSLTVCSKLSVYFVQLTDLLCYQIQLWLELVTDDLVSCHLSDTFSDGTYAAPLTRTHSDALALVPQHK